MYGLTQLEHHYVDALFAAGGRLEFVAGPPTTKAGSTGAKRRATPFRARVLLGDQKCERVAAPRFQSLVNVR
jgi:hypothetical protein